MHNSKVSVCFQPSGRKADVLRGIRLVEAAAEAGLVIETPCGGDGLCGRCRVIVTSGAADPTAAERHWLSAEELREGWRLACQPAVCEPTEVEIPLVVRAAAEHKILTHAVEKVVKEVPETVSTDHKQFLPLCTDPPVRKRYVELLPPARDDDVPDLLRLERALEVAGSPRHTFPLSTPPHCNGEASASGGNFRETAPEPLDIDLQLLREMPARLRAANFSGTAVLANRRLLDFEPGNTEADAFAVALDIGTTTVVAALLDLGTGSELAVNARLNPQTRFGDDVLSRILHARQNADGLKQSHKAITLAVDEMIGKLCRQANISPKRIYEVTFAGNTTMQQLLCGVDTGALGEVPFTPATGRALVFPATELGMHVHPRAGAYVMPVIGGFVGGDTVAGILATGLADTDDPTLLVDIGTNGEIVLQAGGKLWATSTAAGPAFEGARISCGMRGCTGAIEKVVVDGRLRTNVIGNVPPVGLCGSGLIDVAAELLRHRILTPQGRLQMPQELPADVLPDLARRIVFQDGKVSFLLATGLETADGQPIVLTQRDLRQLQLATGAIRAGVAVLVRQAGLEPKNLQQVLIGGGFGNFISLSNAQRIGLLPSEIEHRKIRYVGNTSLDGARLVALSRQARELAEQLARRTQHVDLAADVEFQRVFAESMIFPEA